MALGLSTLGSVLTKGAKFATGEGVRAGLIRGTRGKQRRRDRIQRGLFGKGEGGGMFAGGPLALGSSSSIGSAIPTSQESIGSIPTGTGIIGILESIRSTLAQILEVERQERDRIQESILDFARDKEQSQRTAEQQAQEAKKSKGGIGGLVGGALKSPASNLLGIFGDLAKIGILDWISDPANEKAVQGLVKFFEDTVAVMKWLGKHILGPIAKLGVALILTTVEGLGKIFDVLGNIFDGTIFEDPEKFFGSLLEIPRWLMMDVMPRLIGALTTVLTGGIVTSGEEFVRGLIDAIITWFEGVGEVVTNIAEQPVKTDETKREALNTSESTSGNTAGDNEAILQGSRTKDVGGPGSLNNMTDRLNDPLGLRKDPTGLGGKKFNKGGEVKGYNKGGGVDTVPAWLTMGEYVMSKPAVDFWGSGTFAVMNSVGRDFKGKSTINNALVNNTLINKLDDSSETGKTLSLVQRENNMLEFSDFRTDTKNVIGVSSNTVNTASTTASSTFIGDNYPSFGKMGTTYRTII